MAVSLIIQTAIAIGANLAGAITATQLAFTLFSTFATTVISGSLSKRGRNEKSPIPVSVREPTASHKIVYGTTRVGGTVVFIGSTDRVTTTQGGTRTEEDYFLHILIAVAGHEINAFKKMYFGDELVWDSGTYQDRESGTNWNTFVDLYVHEGDQTTADTILLNGEQISATVEQTAMDGWTSDHKLQGIAYAHIRLKYVPEAFPTGAPQVSFVIEGKKVYDPDTATTAFSNNPALCIRDYLTDTRYGLGETSANIDDTSFINIKDICDEDVALDGGGTQKRYTLDGMLDTSVSIKENLAQLLTSFNGELSYSGGKFYLTGGEYITPTVTISEADIVGPLQIVTKASRRDTYNGVKGVFAAEENNYIDTDYPTATSTIYEAKDGEQILLDVSLPFTTNNIRAQRIAKQIMLQSRQQVVITLPLNLVGMKFKAGDTFYFTNTRLGYSNKPFKVQGWEMAFGDDGEIIVNVTAREAGAVLHPETADTYLTDVYQWQTSDEQAFVVTGQIPVPNASIVAAPTNLAATQSTIISSDGTVSSDFEITWTESENSFVDRYELQYRRTNSITGADGSTIASETEPTSIFVFGTRYVLTGIADGDQYEVKIRALTPLGVQSDFDTTTITASGDVTAPTAPTVVAPSADHERVRLEVTAPTERDVMGIEVFNTTSSSATPTTPSFFIPASPGETVFYNHEKLTNGTTQYYFFRSIDYSDNASAWSSQYSATPLLRYAEGATVGAQVGINLTDENGADISTNFEILNNEIINDSGVDIGKIKDDLVITESIAANAVTANKILVDNLAAINANIGDITAGTLKGGSVPDANDVPSGAETGAFLNLSDGKFVFGDADHNILFDGTDLKINGDIITDLGGSGNNHIVYDGDTLEITGTLSSDDFVSGYVQEANHGTLTRKTTGTFGTLNWDLRNSSNVSLTITSLDSIQPGDMLHLGSFISETLIDGSTRFRLEWSSDYYIELSLINFFSGSDWLRAEISVVTARSSTKSVTDAGVSLNTITLKRFGFDQDESIGWTLKNSGDIEAQAITVKELNQVRLGSHEGNNLVLGDANTLSAITTGVDNIAIGPNAAPAITTEDGNVALGADSVVAAATDNATAIGTQADVSADRAIALGYNATASGTDSIAIGANVTASSNDQIKIGSTQTAVTIGSYDLSNFLTTSTTFGGDVSGTYDAIVVANDSHTHDTRYYTETEADNRFVNVTGDTMSGDLVISKAGAKARFYDSTGTSGNNPFIEFDTTANQGIALELNIYDGELPVAGYGLVVGPSTTNSQFPSTGTLTFNVLGEIYAGGTALGSLNKVFHDGYHPNADKWTTARTLSLTGDVTGSVSWDGSGNASMSTTVAGGDADTLDGLDSTQFLRSDADDTMTGDLRIDGALGINYAASGATGNLHIHDSGDGTTLLRMTDGVTGTSAVDGLVMGLDGSQNGYLINSESSALRFGTSNTERARLDASGNLLLGNNSLAFSEKFRMYGGYAVFDNGTYTGLLGSGTSLGTSTATDFAIRSSNDLAFLTGGSTERLRIDASGNVGIGASPTQKLEVAGAVKVSSNFTGEVAANVGYFDFYSGATRITSKGADGITLGAFSILQQASDGSPAVTALHIDANSNVGVGTIGPAFNTGSGLEIERAGEATLRLQDISNSANGEVRSGNAGLTFYAGAYGTSGAPFIWNAGGTERLRIDSSGVVDVKNVGSAASPSLIFGGDSDTGLSKPISNTLAFSTFGTERMRLDADGKLLVGTTHNSLYNTSTQSHAGLLLDGSNDNLQVARWQGTTAYFNRLSNDGAIIDFRKDGSTVGSISTISGDLFIGTGNTALRFTDIVADIRPVNSSGNNIDATTDLGASNSRFKDLHLSGSVNLGSTIVFEGSTNDANETTLLATDPTADRTIILPDQSGTVMIWGRGLYGDPGIDNIAIGDNALASMGGGAERNTAIGSNALDSVTTGDDNIGIGRNAGTAITTSVSNIAIGTDSLNLLTTGNYNISVGAFSSDTTTGSYNTHIGYSGGPDGNQGNNSYQVSVGSTAYPTGDYGISIGYLAGRFHWSTAYQDCTASIFIGTDSGARSSGANYNTAVGSYTCNLATFTGDFNSMLGNSTGADLTSGSYNVFIGSYSGQNVTTGYYNTFVGQNAGGLQTTSSSNTFVGSSAGNGAVYTGSNLTALGNNAEPSAAGASNEITLGDANIATLRCNVTTISSLSDERDKTDIADIGLGLDFIKAMRPVEFTWDRRDGTRNGVTDIGFIAQELAEVEYQFSSGSRTRLVQIHPDKFEADPMRTYPIMVKAMQEMAAKIEQLEARISQLEGA